MLLPNEYIGVRASRPSQYAKTLFIVLSVEFKEEGKNDIKGTEDINNTFFIGCRMKIGSQVTEE